MFQVTIALSFVSALLAPATVGAQQQPEANDPAYWGDDCFKIDEGTGDDTFRATRDYRLVVLKSGTVNDVFEDVEAGDVLSTASGRNVSHLILCTAVVSTTTTTTTIATTTTTTSGAPP
ncbi:MAG: hypothetical protein GWO04_44885, partial [Actinobacteria bacterium]|nr:hypothetical protein [Actinomycetota bacterium]NIV59031.1 hypothetical protein [Actinomycetota bacterium]NIW26842.1 hypothetical protein [Actinomycetota bacterium]